MNKPQLWVYEGQANFDSVQKSVPNYLNSEAPHWPDVFCLSTVSRADDRMCFDIRDFDQLSWDGKPELLHFGCTYTALDPGQKYTVRANHPRASLFWWFRRMRVSGM